MERAGRDTGANVQVSDTQSSAHFQQQVPNPAAPSSNGRLSCYAEGRAVLKGGDAR